MRGGTLLAFIQEKPVSIAGHGAQGERAGAELIVKNYVYRIGAALLVWRKSA
jgi:hypothetical protein